MMKNIGMIAGNGRFPFLVAKEIRKQGDRVITVALKIFLMKLYGCLLEKFKK